jgi:lipopolysaccharide/colanic/teichoic acid biosynthesis glycosyltransferase
MNARQRAVKRAFDVVVAAVVLVGTMPLMALIALAVVVESPGPIFYRAERVGFRGRRLRMLKFRKMPPQAKGIGLTLHGDARLTRVGALLAKTRMDELPQFWHVLRGEMSLIGPRPESPEFVARRGEDYDQILRVRPGIAGLSQLAFAEEGGILQPDDPVAHYVTRIFPQKCSIDRFYVRQGSLGMDARILFWTVATVLLREPVAVDRRTGRMTRRRRPSQGSQADVAARRGTRFTATEGSANGSANGSVNGSASDSVNGSAAGVEDAASPQSSRGRAGRTP